jgi:Serine dehydrogenase proteinase
MPDSINRSVREFEAAVQSLERRRKSRIFTLIHTGQPQHICRPELWRTQTSRDSFGKIDTLEILIHSPGGHLDIAYQMAKFFRNHSRTLNILVPLYAKSAATLLCLNADAIFMGEFAELGPLDVQVEDHMEKGKHSFPPLNEFKSMEFLKEHATEYLDFFSGLLVERGLSVKQALHESIPGVVGIMNPLYAHIDPSKLGSYRRMLAEGEEYAKRLLNSVNSAVTNDLVQQLVWEYPAHDFVIDYDEALELGLPVRRMDVGQEKSLIKAILGMEEYEIPYVGFVVGQQTKPKRRQSRPKRSSSRKLPASARPAVVPTTKAAGTAG